MKFFKSISSFTKGLTQYFVVDTGYLNVTSPELTAIDLFNCPTCAGWLNHVATVFSELIEVIDPGKLIELAEKINVKYQLPRIGYIFIQNWLT